MGVLKVQTGFILDNVRIGHRYDLIQLNRQYMVDQIFLSKVVWNRGINEHINSNEETKWLSDRTLFAYKLFSLVFTYIRWNLIISQRVYYHAKLILTWTVNIFTFFAKT